MLTQRVCGPQGVGSRVAIGVTVAGGQRSGHRRGGAVGGVGGPAQGELQGGTLRKTLEWRQTLDEESTRHTHFTTPVVPKLFLQDTSCVGKNTHTHLFTSLQPLIEQDKINKV